MNHLKGSEVLVFFCLLFWFSYSDLRSRRINNWLALPAVLGMMIHTGRYLETVLFFIVVCIVGLYDFNKCRFLCDYDDMAFKNERTMTLYRGGDAKLMTLAVATSWLGYLAIAGSWGIVGIYRSVKDDHGPLPYAPFLLAGAMITFSLAYLCRAKIL